MQLFYKPQINGLNGSKPLFFSLHSLPTYTIFCFVAFNGAGSLTVKSCKKRKEKNQDKRCKSSQCVGRYCKVVSCEWSRSGHSKTIKMTLHDFIHPTRSNLRIELDAISQNDPIYQIIIYILWLLESLMLSNCKFSTDF